MADNASDSIRDAHISQDLYGSSSSRVNLDIDDYVAQLQALVWTTPPSSPTSLSHEGETEQQDSVDHVQGTGSASEKGEGKGKSPETLRPGNEDGALCRHCQKLRLSLSDYETARKLERRLYLGLLVMPEASKDTSCLLCRFIRRHEDFPGETKYQREIAESLKYPVPVPQDEASREQWKERYWTFRTLPDLGPDQEIRQLCLTPRQLNSRLFMGGGSTTLTWLSYTRKVQEKENSEGDIWSRVEPSVERKAGHYSFVIATTPGSPSTRYFGGRLVEPPLSHEGLVQMKEWLNYCDSTHALCCSSTHDTQMPTRVVDVGDADKDHEPRLLVTNRQRGRYMALSHRWSSRPFARLLKENLEQFRDSLPKDRLPQSFMDAIQVTRALGIRYLWIDALCIIQDDKDDWRREAELMCSVFENSYCTLAATCSKDGGSFLERTTVPETIPIPCGGDSYVYLVSNFAEAKPKDEIGAAELNRRGWVVQERLLSRRVIHFGESQLYWECRTLTQGQNGEFFTAGGIADFLFPLPKITKALGTGADMPTDTSFQLLWVSIAEHYSACSLSDEDDRIGALLGLADMMGRRTARKFVNGHWFGNGLPMSACLLWTVTELIFRGSGPRVSPSWSWIGLAGKVSFHNTERSTQASPQVLFIEEDEEDTRFSRLLIEGKTLEVEAPENEPSSRVAPVFKKGQQLNGKSSPIGNITFDYVDDRPSDIACLHLYTDMAGYTVVLFMARCCDAELENVYRRVGIGSLSRNHGAALFSDETERIFILK